MKKILTGLVLTLSGFLYTSALTPPKSVSLYAPMANYQESGHYASTTVYWWIAPSTDAVTGYVVKVAPPNSTSTRYAVIRYIPSSNINGSSTSTYIPVEVYASSSSYYNAGVASYLVDANGTTTSLFATSSVIQVVKAPNAPTNLKVKAKTVSSIKLTWKENSTNESAVVLKRWKLVSGNFILDKTEVLARNAATYTDTTVVHGTTYKYGAYEYNGFGLSGFSNYIEVTP